MAMLQNIIAWMEANAAWLPGAAALIQALAAVAAIPVAFIAAYWSAGRNARSAFELSEKREKERRDELIALSRLLLGLEVESNFAELRRFRINLSSHVEDEENSEESKGVHNGDKGSALRLEAKQRFIALYLPDLSYRFWHSQQLSSLLPAAFTRAEIRRITLVYSEYDRLLKIRTIFGERLGRGGKAALSRSGEEAFEGVRAGLSLNEVEDLLSEFDTILNDVIEIGNPIEDGTEEKREEKQKPSRVLRGVRARLKALTPRGNPGRIGRA